MNLLGIDVGTGGTRALLMDQSGRVLSSATSDHQPLSSPQVGWAEQDPQDWWNAACLAIAACLRKTDTPAREVAAVGLTGQMHGLVLLGADDQPLRPALLWCDQRTDQECREITQLVGASRLIEWTANPALTGFTLPKICWVRKHEPQIWDRVRGVLLPKDYIRFRLTGTRATDVADASGTLMFDVVHRRWSQAILKLFQLNEDLLPRVFESPQVTSHISELGARATGLNLDTPVVAGAGDQAAGALGMGIVTPGAVSATIGTSGVVFAATGKPLLEPGGRLHTFCHAIPQRWHVMGVTLAAGQSLRWFRDQFGAGLDDGRDPYERLMGEAAKAPPGADGLLFAPYLMGERTPHLDPHARGAFVGLTAQHTRAYLIRAILEGVAFSLRDTLTLFREIAVPIDSIRLGGGGARAPLWQQIQADIYGMPVELIAADEGAAFGAALLAGVGVGVWPSVEAACSAAVHVQEIVRPSQQAVDFMNTRYAEYRKLYPALRPFGPSY
jgi:xylulokinase